LVRGYNKPDVPEHYNGTNLSGIKFLNIQEKISPKGCLKLSFKDVELENSDAQI